MNILVKFWSDVPNPDNLPESWPAEVQIYKGQEKAGFTLMTMEELEAHKALHQLEYDAWEVAQNAKISLEMYKELRKEAYPEIGDQLDCLYKAMKDGILPDVIEFTSPIDAVKTMYPKV